jgi:Mg2+ and Co2+ transporter CorA
MSDSSSEEDEDEFPEVDEQTTQEQQHSDQKSDQLLPSPQPNATSSSSKMTGKLVPLPHTVNTSGETDLAVAEQLVNSGAATSKYAEQRSTEPKVSDADKRNSSRLRAKSVHSRRGSIHTEFGGDVSQVRGWAAKLIQNKLAGGVEVSAKDHTNILVSYWEFDQDVLRSRAADPHDGTVQSEGSGPIEVDILQPFLEATVKKSAAEKDARQATFDALAIEKRRDLKKKGSWAKADSCRWFHLPGCSHKAVDIFAEAYKLDASVAEACKAVSGKPICSWHQNEDKTFDHLFVAAHYIQKSSEEASDGISGYIYEQVFMIYYPALNTVISIDANGEKEWHGVTDLLRNECGFVRTNEDSSVLIYKLLDSMIDEVYPLLDLYGDLLESLEFETMAAPEPTDEHVRTSFKLKRRVHSLRRYAWGMRQLLQELRQNNFGVITKETIKMMTSVERNAENMVEVACAYMEQCVGIESFYDSFQEKVQGSTLYILTISSVTIMPFQLLTGLFGANTALLPLGC